ncbi:MAG: ABC transporter permease [Propionibacterium sp.]|nr:ABC transporter permease [Propionibacterium sp.]
MALDTGERTARPPRPRPFGGLYAGNMRAVLERGFIVLAKQNWAIVASGFFEPVFYLLAMGLGLGGLVGTVTGPGGRPITYAAYIAPALLATSAMNGAVYDSTMNVFFKLRYAKLYQAMLQTSLGALDVAAGEIAMALVRGLLYACAFMVVMVVMGLVSSWWAVLMVPAALLVAFGFAGIGMAATSFMKTFQHLDMVSFLLLPMFLFSSTLYPIDVFPVGVRWLIMAMPLWHGVEMMRQLSVGALSWATAGHLLYFVAMSLCGVTVAARRLRSLFLR